MSKDQFQESVKRLKQAEKPKDLSKKEWEEEQKKQEEKNLQIELEYRKRKNAAAEKIMKGIEQFKKESND